MTQMTGIPAPRAAEVNWLIVGYLIGLVNSLLNWIPVLGVGITMYVGGVFSYTVYSEIFERGEN